MSIRSHEAEPSPELSRLLAAAAAPARPDELVDLRAAVAAFEAAGRDGESAVAMPRRRRVFAGGVVMRAAAVVAVALFGGVALAAETGSLPSGAQQHAHDAFSLLGVPSPTAVPAPPSPLVRPTGSPSADDRGQTSQPAPAVLGLCRSWEARQKDPKGTPVQSQALRTLAAAAGGAEHIATFCAALLTAEPTTVGTASSRPGNGKGRTHPTHTLNPHKPVKSHPSADRFVVETYWHDR